MKRLTIKLAIMMLVLTSFTGCTEEVSEIDVNEVMQIAEEIQPTNEDEEETETDEVDEEVDEETETDEEVDEETDEVDEEIETDVVDEETETDEEVDDETETDEADEETETDEADEETETDEADEETETDEADEETETDEVEEVAPITEELVEEPVVEEIVVEEPVIEEPVIEEPVVEEPVIEETVVETPVIEETVVETPVVTTTVATNVTPTTVPDPQVKAQIYNQLIANANSSTQFTVYGTAVPSSSYMYRNMLSAEEQSLYDQLYSGLIKAQTSIPYSTSLSSDYLSKVSMYVYMDHPELIWVNLMGYTADGSIFTPTYNGAQSQVATYYDTMATILANAKDLPNDMEKIKYIQNYISYHTKFDVSYVMANDSQTAYSCLVGKRTVCSGYAKGFQHCMQLLGIPTTAVSGSTTNGTHVWNLIYLGGEYYNMDVNWDDWSSDPNQYNYSYFMVTDAQLTASRASHVRDSISANLPKAYGATYTYKNYFG